MHPNGHFPNVRMRRLRQTPALRRLVQDVELRIDKLVLPLFIHHGKNINNPIASMPGHAQLSVDHLPKELDQIQALGIRNILLFGIPAHKDGQGSGAFAQDGVVQQATRFIKESAPDLLLMSDICCCEYTDHGHCGIIDTHSKQVCNDETLALLGKQAITHAQAGADILAPSGCMDGMVQAMRQALDAQGFSDRTILSYAVKYASSMYGPFRDAAQGAPKFGDRRAYQMDFRRQHEALRECALDVAEGADMLMVKPAHAYLDIIRQVKDHYPELPLGAYHTSGEFAMIKAAGQNGWIDEQAAAIEITNSIFRAGADFIFSYYTKDLAAWKKAGVF
jgi:porphobilinogen synthase